MQSYHLAWLSAHPERSPEWLESRLKDGFDVHHLDGDHTNDDAANLVLIECSDHLMLHNGGKRISRIMILVEFNKRKNRFDLTKCKLAYELYSPETGWHSVARALGFDSLEGTKACQMARRYAISSGVVWPLDRPIASRKRPPKLQARDRLALFRAQREAI